MKKISDVSLLIPAILLAGLCGCASNSGQSSNPPGQPVAQASQTTAPAPAPPPKPKKDKRPIEDRLIIGMTMDQVKQACGSPKNVSMDSDGSAVWMYNNAENVFIPNYTLFGGKIHYVTVIFDTNGKVKSWSSTSRGAY